MQTAVRALPDRPYFVEVRSGVSGTIRQVHENSLRAIGDADISTAIEQATAQRGEWIQVKDTHPAMRPRKVWGRLVM